MMTHSRLHPYTFRHLSFVLLCIMCLFNFTCAAATCQTLPAVGLPADEPANADDYVLGPGDVLSITDATVSTSGVPLTNQAKVGPDGNVSIFPVGIVRASGKTLTEINSEVQDRYRSMADQPEILVGLESARPVEVYVLGDVRNPGRYRSDQSGGAAGSILISANPFVGDTSSATPPPQTRGGGALIGGLLPFSPVAAGIVAATGLGRSTPTAPTTRTRNVGGNTATANTGTTMTVLTAIQNAGGVREHADIRHIQLRRGRASATRVVDLWSLLKDGDASQDVVLKSGDVVVVPHGGEQFHAEELGLAANRSRPVKVFGAVKQPGIYELAPDDDVLSVVSRAGGFTETAKQGHVVLSRKQADGSVVRKRVSVRRSMKDTRYLGRQPVISGDIVEAKESIVKRVGPRALTIGSTFLSAFMILYFSRIIVDKSQPTTNQQTTTTGVNLNNAGPLGLPSVF